MQIFPKFNYNFEKSLNNRCNLSLNGILTSAHALNSDEGRSNFYFVQSANLDLATEFPEGINDKAELTLFLLANGDSFKIGDFTIKNKENNLFSNMNLSMGQPQYFANEDVLIGSIHLRIPQAFLLYNNDYPVAFKNFLPARGDNYYALGYPGCDHYRLNAPIPLLPYPPLIQDMGISPLFITRSTHTRNFPVNANINGTLIHRAPAAEGMSGGPLFHLENNRLNFFGVITEGEDDEEKGCHWF